MQQFFLTQIQILLSHRPKNSEVKKKDPESMESSQQDRSEHNNRIETACMHLFDASMHN